MTFAQSENLRHPELLTYHTLMVPAQNELLRAGCSINTKLNDTRIQTSAHWTGKNELKCIKNRIAYEWISICAKTENNKLFDDAAKELMQNILTLATKDDDMHKVFVVASVSMFCFNSFATSSNSLLFSVLAQIEIHSYAVLFLMHLSSFFPVKCAEV
jgi:hypothetical protein